MEKKVAYHADPVAVCLCVLGDFAAVDDDFVFDLHVLGWCGHFGVGGGGLRSFGTFFCFCLEGRLGLV